MRPVKLVLFERARRARFRAAMCREIAAMTDKAEANLILEELAQDFEVDGAKLERKARQMRTAPARSGMESMHDGAVVVQIPQGDFEESESS